MTALAAQLARRILVLDGAMATLLLQPDPPEVEDLHRAYLAAGADIITTNTFRPASYQSHVAAARVARRAADAASRTTPEQPRFVAGGLGPTGQKTLAAVRDIYRDQMRALIDGGVDVLLVETIVDTLHARAAIEAVGEAQTTRGSVDDGGAIPLMLSITVTNDGRMLSGETIADLHAAIARTPPFCIGINCGLGARDVGGPLEALGRIGTYVSCHPSAGVPDAFGHYDESPADTARLLAEFARSGLLDIAGGCCGTSPEHIEAIAAAVRDVPVGARRSGARARGTEAI
jgi:5-methyltetrahydrofolate--homocysteine methyltransferase